MLKLPRDTRFNWREDFLLEKVIITANGVSAQKFREWMWSQCLLDFELLFRDVPPSFSGGTKSIKLARVRDLKIPHPVETKSGLLKVEFSELEWRYAETVWAYMPCELDKPLSIADRMQLYNQGWRHAGEKV